MSMNWPAANPRADGAGTRSRACPSDPGRPSEAHWQHLDQAGPGSASQGEVAPGGLPLRGPPARNVDDVVMMVD